jgi:hypothetical protein
VHRGAADRFDLNRPSVRIELTPPPPLHDDHFSVRRKRRIRLGIAALIALFTLAVPGVAVGQAITITPTRFDDPAAGPVGCLPTDCSLRQAVAAVSGAQPVTISLQPGRYDLTQGVPLVVQSADVVTIDGAGARATTIHGNNLGSVFDLQEGSDTTINDVTITGGNSAAGQDPAVEGGAVRLDVAGRFELNRSAIIGNRASSQGGGISSFSNSPVQIADSVIAGNTAGNAESPALGGGIYSTSQLILRNSTVSGNQLVGTTTLGAGVYATAAIDLVHVTIAGNSAPAARGTSLQLQSALTPPPTTIWNTIVTADVGAACAINRPTTGDHNLDGDGTCAFMRPGDKPAVNPLLAPLANSGGPTDTRALLAGSPAIDAADATHCRLTDQRGIARPQAVACDIGAFEYVPPPPLALPSQPPPDDGELPPPVAGKTVNALPKSGRVRIKLPKTDKFVRLRQGQQVPVGTVFDTRNGHVTLVAAANRQGGTATAEFWAGIFRLGQNRKARPTTTLTLTEKLSCPKAGSATTAAKRKKKRRLWGNGSGKFRTKGKHSAATVVGTKWLVEDRCTSTLTRVVRGRVSVRDFVKKQNIVVRKGKKYVARARRS